MHTINFELAKCLRARARLREPFYRTNMLENHTLTNTCVAYRKHTNRKAHTTVSRYTKTCIGIASHAQRNSIQKSSTGKLRSFKNHSTLGMRSHQTGDGLAHYQTSQDCASRSRKTIRSTAAASAARCLDVLKANALRPHSVIIGICILYLNIVVRSQCSNYAAGYFTQTYYHGLACTHAQQICCNSVCMYVCCARTVTPNSAHACDTLSAQLQASQSRHAASRRAAYSVLGSRVRRIYPQPPPGLWRQMIYGTQSDSLVATCR